MTARETFRERYGPWALVAGASEGLGAEFARQIAARGLHLVLVARRGDLLEAVAGELQSRHGVQTRTAVVDMGAADAPERLRAAAAGLEIGLAVANAAFAPVGPFLERPLGDALRAVDVNCRGPLAIAHVLGAAMAARGRGGLVLMSSLAGQQGSPGITAYAATKAFNTVLAEGLWAELRPLGVDVVVCTAGAILTPGFAQASTRRAPGSLPPGAVARAALDALGHGPRVVPGPFNRVAAGLMARVLPRRTAIGIMAGQTGDLARG